MLLPLVFACGQIQAAVPALPAMTHVFRDPFSGRAFVLVDDAVPEPDKLAWETIAPPDAPMMYILPADIADARDPKRARTFTLITADGAVVVKTKKKVYLRGVRWESPATTAFEIDPDDLGQARFAISGEHGDARLVPASWTASESPFATAWVHDQGWELHDTWDHTPPPVFSGDIPGTGFLFVNAWLAGHDREETLILRGKDPLQWFDGSIDGVLSIDGRMPIIHTTTSGTIELVEL